MVEISAETWKKMVLKQLFLIILQKIKINHG